MTNKSNENEYVILREAARRSKYSKKQIQKLAEPPFHRIRTKKENGTIYFNLPDILKYYSAHPEETILNTVWDEIDYVEGECFYPLFGYDCKYFISNKGRVINCSNGQVLTPKPREKDGYNNVSLTMDGKSKTLYRHRLIGLTQCKNSLNKDEFHHVKISNPAIDTPENILPVWHEQHLKLHRLIKEGKTDEYKKMVKEIKKENSQKIYEIPHLDFKSDDTTEYFMRVTKTGYNQYLKYGDVSLGEIVGEGARLKKAVIG